MPKLSVIAHQKGDEGVEGHHVSCSLLALYSRFIVCTPKLSIKVNASEFENHSNLPTREMVAIFSWGTFSAPFSSLCWVVVVCKSSSFGSCVLVYSIGRAYRLIIAFLKA